MTVSLNLPFGLGGLNGTWEPDESERLAAWEMYVELATRVSFAELDPGTGLLREALSSLHELFPTTRAILRQHGPSVAQVSGESKYSFGQLAVIVLNDVLRPVLSTWHPRLLDHESRQPDGMSSAEHEETWERSEELRGVLTDVRATLAQYADLLAEVAGVPSVAAHRI